MMLIAACKFKRDEARKQLISEGRKPTPDKEDVIIYKYPRLNPPGKPPVTIPEIAGKIEGVTETIVEITDDHTTISNNITVINNQVTVINNYITQIIQGFPRIQKDERDNEIWAYGPQKEQHYTKLLKRNKQTGLFDYVVSPKQPVVEIGPEIKIIDP